MNALVRALAVELARYGITANAILPGWIRSEMTAEIMTNEKLDKVAPIHAVPTKPLKSVL
jgi:NAD(P)-dependent dehydrogenase (short-subunit alcohol dehydrogenase family)